MASTPENLTLMQIMDRFPTDEAARVYLESQRWPNGPTCPGCGEHERLTRITANPEKRVRAGLIQCRACRKQFTVTTGTIFESTKIPLRKWIIAWYLLCASKKGVSALQIQRMLSLGSYDTAWHMMHRIRHALRDPAFAPADQLGGVPAVEADATWIGGKRRGVGRGYVKNKTAVVTLVERGGRSRSFVMKRVTGADLEEVLAQHVDPTTVLNTDEDGAFLKPGRKFRKHERVNHKRGEYVRGDATTNTVEGFFANLKRGIDGIYHHVGERYLPLYLGEFDFRYCQREVTDGERTVAGLARAEGKRLMMPRRRRRPVASVSAGPDAPPLTQPMALRCRNHADETWMSFCPDCGRYWCQDCSGKRCPECRADGDALFDGKAA